MDAHGPAHDRAVPVQRPDGRFLLQRAPVGGTGARLPGAHAGWLARVRLELEGDVQPRAPYRAAVPLFSFHGGDAARGGGGGGADGPAGPPDPLLDVWGRFTKKRP